MKSEKRMVGDYTVLCAVNIGSREIILAENEQDSTFVTMLVSFMSILVHVLENVVAPRPRMARLI